MAKLGQLLVARSWITVQQLTRALQNQNSVGGRLGTCLLEMDVLGEDLLSRSLAEQLGVPAATIEELRGVPEEVLHLIPEKLARRCRAVPFRVAGGRLDVAMQDPRNLSCQDEIAFASGRRVKVHVCHEIRILEALQKYYDQDCPPRFVLLLDRLNRARYLWEKEQAPKPPAVSYEETLPALPLNELFGGNPAMAPSPLPEPSLPPTPRPRASGILPRPQPPAAPAPPSSPAHAADAASPASAVPEVLHGPPAQSSDLPPLAEVDLRATPRHARGPDPHPSGTLPRDKPSAAVRGAGAPSTPLMAIPSGLTPGDVPPLAPERRGAASDPRATAPRPRPLAVSPAAPVTTAAPPRPSLEAPRAASPAADEAPTSIPAAARETVTLTDQERAALGVSPEEAAVPPAADADRAAGSSFAEVEAALAATADREEVGRVLLHYLGQEYRRVALFLATRDRVRGWMAQGDGIDQQAFANYTVGFDQPSVFLNVREGSGMHLGALPPMPAHRDLSLIWGGGLPRDCVVLPVRLNQRLVVVMYADGGSHGLWGLDLDHMQRLTGAAAAAFERCVQARKGGGT